MNPASGVRRIKLAPHAMLDSVTATEDIFVLAHLGIPQVDPDRWSLAIDGLVAPSPVLTWHRRGRGQH